MKADKHHYLLIPTSTLTCTYTPQASAPSHYELINKAYVTEEEIRERPDEVYEAEEDYRGRGDTELTFLRGAIIKNVEQDPDHVGWLVFMRRSQF